MPEVNVRNCCINLLDGSQVCIQIKPSQLASELLSIIAIQLKLRDKEYFGLYYDVNGEYQYWLHPGRPVVEQVSDTYPDIITLHFGVLVYIENFRHLQDAMALNQYYNQCQQLIYQGTLHCQQQTLVKLAAIVLQIHLGNFTTEEKASKRGFECLRLFTRSLPAEVLSDCEREALSQYSLLKGLPASEAISTYLELVQELPSYGMHFYEVKDKNHVQKLIGIGLNGIAQFNFENRNRPELSFQWTEINKITSRDSKFLIEVRIQSEESSLERLQVDQNAISISPTLQYQSIVSVHSWYSDTPQLIRTMDSMAVTQLNFFEQRKKFRVGIHLHSSTSSSNSASSFCSLTHSSSACTQNSDCSVASMETTQAAKVASREHYVALKNTKEELEQTIEEKEAELRRLVIEEAKLTGIVPDELTEEEKSTLPKQMATAYTLQHLVETIRKDQSEFSSTLEPPEEDKELKRLTREFEIQCSIVKAEYKIYKQDYTNKKIKKQRKKNYKNSEKKLKQLEGELEKRREVLGISTRHSRFYSQVSNKEEFTWNVQSMSSKSMTMPTKQKTKAGNNIIGKLSAVNENQVSKPHPNSAPRHSSAIPGRIDPAMIRNRQFKYSPTVFKKSNGSDSISTTSPLDGSSFLSLYSKDSSRLSSCSLTSDDEDRCISCPATEPLAIKPNHKIANGIDRGQRVSQHLDLALPPQVQAEKAAKEPLHNLDLDMPAQVIFRPSTRYPKFPPTNSRQSPAEFYARSLPMEQISNSEVNGTSQSPSSSKKHFTSDQISKQHSDQKPAYTQHNPSQPHNTAPAASVPLNSAGTHYPMPCLRVNSLPYGLYKSKSRSQELINYDPLQPYRSSSPHNLTSPSSIHFPQVSNDAKEPYNYGGKLVHSNYNKPPIPIARIHTTPTNITTFEYSKPTHYPQARSSSPREDRRASRSPQTVERERRVRSQQYVVHNPWYPQLQQPAVLSPAQTRYIPPNCRLSGSAMHEQSRLPPDQHARYRSPYNHHPVPPLNIAPNSRSSQQKPYIDPNSLYPPMHLKHDALTYTHSLPLSPPSVESPPNVKSKINYWENHNLQRHIPLTQSMQQMETSDFPPGIDGTHNMQSLNLRSAPVPNTYRRLINSDGFQYPMVVEKREFAELLTSPEEGTPV